MFKIFVWAVLVVAVLGACPPLSSIYTPGKVRCPLCDFSPFAQSLSGSGNQYTLKCPSGSDVWFYNDQGKEFVTPMSKIGARGTIKCEGSKWRISVPGQSQLLVAFACGSS